MRVLAIKQPWASLIADGEKTIEVRSRPTNIRERVAIYASLTKPNKELIRFRNLQRGVIIATVDIVGCKKYTMYHSFASDRDKHHIPIEIDEPYSHGYGWLMENVKKLDNPIPFKMPKGCVVWANTDIEVE